MSQNQTRSSVRNEDIRTMESKDELYDKQHLSNIELDKIRNVIKTKVSGELIISEINYSPMYSMFSIQSSIKESISFRS